jgi:hypothetical protein
VTRLRQMLASCCARILVALMVPQRPDGMGKSTQARDVELMDQSIKPSAASTFDLLDKALLGTQVEPGKADPATLIKIICLLLMMHSPTPPAVVLAVVEERLQAAEDTAAIAHLDPDRDLR